MQKLILAAALLVVGLASPAAAQNCSLNLMAALDVTGLPSRVVIEVSVAGTPRKFLVDTGGVYSEISQTVVDALGLAKSPIRDEVYGMGGEQLKYGATIPSLKIGNNELQNVHMLVMPPEDGIDGVLAPDILQVFDVDFDMAAKKLRLFSQDHCPGKVVYWTTSYSTLPFKLADRFHITLPAELDGHSLNTILDTGSSINFLDQNVAHQVFSLDETSPGMEKTQGTLGGMPVYRKTFQSLLLSGISVPYTTVYIQPPAAEDAYRKNHSEKWETDAIYGKSLDIQPLLIGMDVLHKLHVYIAYKEHTLYLTTADAH